MAQKSVSTTTPVKAKKKAKRMVDHGHAHILSTYNNTIITITDLNGNALSWSTSGSRGFKGPKKSTPYAAGAVAKDAVDKAKIYGLQRVDVFVKGIGSGRESAIRGIQNNGIEVLSITDVTPVAHNGCRPKKVRRV
jgi:small subunit ribosomal protein S11